MSRTLTFVLLGGFATAHAATTYYVDPSGGNDRAVGSNATAAWKSFEPLNARDLGPGDTVLVAPGLHTASLRPKAHGESANPAVIRFLPGTHEFAPEKATRIPLFVSNSCDAPTTPKPVGVLVENCAHLRFAGAGVEGSKKTLLLMGGRMIEAANLNSEDIAYTGLVFDLKRPTVSEFRVLATDEDSATVQVAEGSTYAIEKGKFRWTGDIGVGPYVMVQRAVPATDFCRRIGGWNPFKESRVEVLAPNKLKIQCPPGKKLFGMKAGEQYQHRLTVRDSVGIHNARSKNIRFEDCDVYALTGMGFVSQFTENIVYRRVRVAPPAGTIRTCPAWGDVFHFSNCKGLVLIEDCVESGMQDDAVNCHGTHLRIVGKPAENQLKIRYMHGQTYGFAPYIPGDELAVVDWRKLVELPGNPRRRVTACKKAGDDGREWIVTLDGAAPAYEKNDVVDNVGWHPDLTIRGSRAGMNPVRGYLISTRGKVLVENNVISSASPAILVEDDASGWFESTCVRDLTIRNNRFLTNGVTIDPQVKTGGGGPVHENIRIENNEFFAAGVTAHGVKNLVVTGNTFAGDPQSAVRIRDCPESKVENNRKR